VDDAISRQLISGTPDVLANAAARADYRRDLLPGMSVIGGYRAPSSPGAASRPYRFPYVSSATSSSAYNRELGLRGPMQNAG
jgi:hypothetical protein